MCLLLVLAWAAAPADAAVRLNEVMASNGATIADEDGDFEDWVELVNTGPGPAPLSGYGLSDRDDRPFRWVFPDVVLPPGGFLLVWASGKDRDDPGMPLHTNFSIAAGGEPILLTAPDGTLVDRLESTPIPRDVSLGRQPDGEGDWLFFDVPTPGAPNTGDGYAGILDPPVFSHEGGFYTQGFALSLSTSGGTIYYTLDGSHPDSANLDGRSFEYKQQYPHRPGQPFGELIAASFHSQVYGGPIPIVDRSGQPDRLTQRSTTYDDTPARYLPKQPVFKGTVVRARAEAPGYLPSPTITHTYFVTPGGRGRFGLPVLALTVQEDHLYDYERGIHVAGIDFDTWRMEDPDNPSIRGHRPANYRRRGREAEYPVTLELFVEGPFATLRQELGLRIHGGSSRSHPQKSLRLYARRDYDERSTLQYPFFPGLTDRHTGQALEEFDRILLRTSGNDSARDPVSYQAISATRVRDAFQHRLIAPLGLDDQAYAPAVHFINGEYWGLINLRENIDDHMLSRRHGIERDEIILLSGNGRIETGTEADQAEWFALRDYIGANDMADPAQYAFVSDFIDMDNFLKYKAALIYMASVDWPGNNIDFWRKRTPDRSPGAPPAHDGRWRWIVFDLDHAFQLTNHRTLRVATQAGGTTSPNPDWSTVILRSLLRNPDFRAQYINTTADLINSIFVPGHILPMLDEMYGRIAPYLPEHSLRWPHTGSTSIQVLQNFAYVRPGVKRNQIVDYFGLAGQAPITIDTDRARGRVRVNSLVIDETLAGTNPATPYPWSGVYFQGVPIELEAIPEPGYHFAGWSSIGSDEQRVTLTPGGPLAIMALFLPTERHPADINGDGALNAVDVQLVINGALGVDIAPYNPDITGDGAVNAVDVQLVINAALGVS